MTSASKDRAVSRAWERFRLGLGVTAVALVAAGLPLAGVPAAPGPTGGQTDAAAPPRLGAESYAVTLITGDRVTLESHGGSGYAVEVEVAPRPDGSKPIVEVSSTRAPGGEEELYALPADALALIASGRIDRELFNVEYLAASGYHDRARDEIPVIVEYARQPDNLRRATADLLPTATVTTTLESIDGAGLTLDKDEATEFWAGLAGGSGVAATGAPRLPSGIQRIWLDRAVEVDLDRSAPQIGAPEAWGAGLDGTGVDVAVLDTGIDLGHPDVAGKIAASRSFIPGQTVTDGHGHGTHVASIVAGLGTASQGRFKGVAPGAQLTVGKVLANNGTGPTSGVIDGMEWAASEQDADVVNLSLGSVPTDGTDPASQAVNVLTEDTGALFVIASGNTGPASFSVSSPGAASSALTVGAVDKADQLAGFSSRGPRLGDHAIKPEITGPGVNIIAARAAGTRRGIPFDDFYTSLSGTSMATPHVAGAAAILAQQHPEWGAEQIKAALVSTASDGGNSVYEQGSGRVDVARAFAQDVQVAPATADFELLPSPPDGPTRTRVLTYRNPTGEDVALDLTATLRKVNGDPVPGGVLSVDPARVEVPAGGSVSATVSLDAAGLDSGLYTGSVLAAGAGDLRLRTPVGFAVGAQAHDLRITIEPREDVDAFEFSGVSIYGVEGAWAGQSIACGASSCPQPLEFHLANGTYLVRALVSWNDSEGERQLASLVDPEFTVTGDDELVLDANAAERITVDTEQPSETRGVSPFSTFRSSSDGAFRLINLVIAGGIPNWWVTPTERVTKGDFAIATHWLLGPPGPDEGSPEYLYQLKLVEVGRVPDSQDYGFRDRDLVRVDNHYHADEPGTTLNERWFTWAPWEFAVGGVSHPVLTQTTVREYAAPTSPDFVHERNLLVPGSFQPLDETMDVYRKAGKHVEQWNERPNAPGAVVHPDEIAQRGLSAPLWWWVCTACRQGDNFYPFMHQTAAGERHTLGQFGRPFGFGDMHLYRNGEEVPQSDPYIGAFTTYALPPEPAQYRLTLEHENTTTAWEFESSKPAIEATPPGHDCVETVFGNSTTQCRAEPLLFLRYDAGVGIDNRVPAPGDHRIFVKVYRQDRTSALPIRGLRLWFSTDDGAEWRGLKVKPLGQGRYRAQLRYPRIDQTSGRISLRAEAWDADANRVDQTIIGAWGLRARGKP